MEEYIPQHKVLWWWTGFYHRGQTGPYQASYKNHADACEFIEEKLREIANIIRNKKLANHKKRFTVCP